MVEEMEERDGIKSSLENEWTVFGNGLTLGPKRKEGSRTSPEFLA